MRVNHIRIPIRAEPLQRRRQRRPLLRRRIPIPMRTRRKRRCQQHRLRPRPLIIRVDNTSPRCLAITASKRVALRRILTETPVRRCVSISVSTVHIRIPHQRRHRHPHRHRPLSVRRIRGRTAGGQPHTPLPVPGVIVITPVPRRRGIETAPARGVHRRTRTVATLHQRVRATTGIPIRHWLPAVARVGRGARLS